MTKRNRKSRNKPLRRPRILVLEGLSSAGECVDDAGGIAVEVSPFNLQACVDAWTGERIHGMLLTGGGDVDPRRYGERPVKDVYGVSQVRDIIEIEALTIARALRIPVLGICRGAQIMTVEAGGKMRQHIPGHYSDYHEVIASEESLLAKVTLGSEMNVVSLHHQEVRKPGRGFRISGLSSDGIVEAVESLDGRCLGVQFHPEMDFDRGYAFSIFRWLVTESARRAGLPTPPIPERKKPTYTIGYGFRLDEWGDYAWDDRPAKTPSDRKPSRVITTWLCPTCAMQFDAFQDREDHVAIVHPTILPNPKQITADSSMFNKGKEVSKIVSAGGVRQLVKVKVTADTK